MVENGPAWRVLDDELEQLYRRIGQASGGFDEEDSEVIWVRGEVPEDGPIPSLFSRGPDLLDPRDARDSFPNQIENFLGPKILSFKYRKKGVKKIKSLIKK